VTRITPNLNLTTGMAATWGPYLSLAHRGPHSSNSSKRASIAEDDGKLCSRLTSVLHLAVSTKTKKTADDENESRTPSILLYRKEKNSNAHNSVHKVTKGTHIMRSKRNGPIGKRERENEGVDYTPQLFISRDEKAVRRRGRK
jgi:hypothetical protein